MKILFIVFYMLTAISSFSQNRKAEKLYDKAVKTYDKKNYVKALSLLNKSIDANPKDADSYNLRGCIFQDLNRYKESIEDFNTSIDLKEDNPDAFLIEQIHIMIWETTSQLFEIMRKAFN